MNIKGNSDDKLSLNKTVEIPTITIVVRTVFLENNINIIHTFYPMNACTKYKNKK